MINFTTVGANMGIAAGITVGTVHVIVPIPFSARQAWAFWRVAWVSEMAACSERSQGVWNAE